MSLVSFTVISQTLTPKVLVLGIDGLRPEALKAANTPNLDYLMQNGTFSYDAFTDFPTTTYPGFSSMLAGVWNSKHKVLSINTTFNQYSTYPFFMKRVEEADSNFHTVMIARPPFSPIFNHVQNIVDKIYYIQHDINIKELAVAYLKTQDPDAMFTYFYEPDHEGHVHGFSSAVPAYKAAIEQTDAYIGELLGAIAGRPTYSSEDWLVLVGTDHGGFNKTHGGTSVVERNVFFIAAGASVTNQEIKRDTTEVFIDSAALFNGINHFAKIPFKPAYNFGSSADFTVECWVKPTPGSPLGVMLSNQDLSNVNSKGFSLAYNLSNNKKWLIHIADGTQSVTNFGNQLSDAEFQHIAFTVNRDQLVTLYQNGVNIRADFIYFMGDVTTTRDLTIGQDGVQSFFNHFKGSIKELRIWNTVLTEKTIGEYACKPLDYSHPRLSRLVGYWKMDQVEAGNFRDLSVVKNHAQLAGSIMNFQTVNAPMRCLNFNQTPRIVDIAYTALSHLCIPIQPSWGLDGRSWLTADCITPSCTDGLQNGNETDIDCGGSCPPCVVANRVESIVSGYSESAPWKALHEEGSVCKIAGNYEADGNHRCIGNHASAPDLNIDQLLASLTKENKKSRAKAAIALIENVKIQSSLSSEELQVSFLLSEAANMHLFVSDMQGKITELGIHAGVRGTQLFSLNTSRLPAGLYHLHLVSADSNVMEKFVVVN